MATEFYNVKKKKKVMIDDSKIRKTKYEAKGKTRYAFRAVDDDGTNLTRFCSEGDWSKKNCPAE